MCITYYLCYGYFELRNVKPEETQEQIKTIGLYSALPFTRHEFFGALKQGTGLPEELLEIVATYASQCSMFADDDEIKRKWHFQMGSCDRNDGVSEVLDLLNEEIKGFEKDVGSCVLM